MLPVLDEEVIRHRIAKRIALDFEDGSVVNLGIGIPTLVSDYLPEDVHVLLQTENGVVGAGPKPEKEDLRLIGAGGRCVSLLPGSSLVASDMSFGLIRGGHLDATVLGALEVDSFGNLANWMIPGKMVPGMGGAMDLVTGARAVYVATTHCDKKGRPKLVKECTLPLTGAKVVSVVVTEFCVVRKVNGKMVLCEISPEITEEELRANTTMDYDISPDLCPMKGIE
ncbi:3-oxoacid CoA-transferase subunit B/acetate CoA/acetoacetate CoA-transferase beta subunit [Aminivibrio pyruvatiphilus]|jgi:3-oxoacid CoA-transferase subunit B/acetate CoA/acetoacetate CoA-transferase beta subunit|uniref:3-oxoacid CoA-transferase subunit B/acetate CoA/acetoacetate CoA-transferase beta subunit n=1 Tax=Aminivibrio pyruvatiphilus TaxID=1005740 RepID=A0A4R8MBG4_9BACT|nr:3-oxoacid CoA-transferase subunit B [Aminivibrio pyruvatiphilus]TDY61602.1 3-oxoacid CoA-transferase subunit B/acetate CoA/acetoacetate CoA-transferase beta subunit [Aminivibrio pyruvatiphilus]